FSGLPRRALAQGSRLNAGLAAPSARPRLAVKRTASGGSRRSILEQLLQQVFDPHLFRAGPQVPGLQPLFPLALEAEVFLESLLEVRHVRRPVEDGDLLLSLGK